MNHATARYLTRCTGCGNNTSKKFAREHSGLCKPCTQPEASPTREQRIIDSGYQAYALEEGHYDQDQGEG